MSLRYWLLWFVFLPVIGGCQGWQERSGTPVAERAMNQSGWVPPVQAGDIFLPPATLGTQLEPGTMVPFPEEMMSPDPMGLPSAIPEMPVPGLPQPIDGQALQNPLFVPVTNHDAAWREIVDVMDDYFPIRREERVQEVGGLLTEGRIETYPQGGATHVEPHRYDSVGRFNRWQSTLQTIRRTASARIVPTHGGYSIDLTVQKELEDLPRPEQATAGAATFRSDGSLPSRRAEEVSHSYASPNWIPLGRDTPLEQQILSELLARLDVTPQGVVY
ncbi:MAG: hypothetical protein JW829_05675 [Pirellulales bacterium]|nr:hypothetical protein [Pirellulales bacterium]